MARARSRKRRPAGARRASAGTGREGAAKAPGDHVAGGAAVVAGGRDGVATGRKARKAAPAAPRAKARGGPKRSPTAPTYGERPQAPWHPLPLAELLILAGAVAAVFGFKKLSAGISGGGPTVLAGVGAVAIGTLDTTLREHLTGYRSHTIMLSAIPVLIFTSVVVFGLSAVTTVPRPALAGVFAVDLALFAFLFKLFRARFLDARHARVVREG
jgi:hypothetical protein